MAFDDALLLEKKYRFATQAEGRQLLLANTEYYKQLSMTIVPEVFPIYRVKRKLYRVKIKFYQVRNCVYRVKI